MDVIVVILMIILAVVGSNSKKKKQGAKPGQTPSRPAGKAANTSGALKRAVEELSRQVDEVGMTPAQKQQAAEDAAALEKAKARARRKADARQKAKTPAPATPAQPTVTVSREGMSAFDDEGCVGGSMPHDHTEGESHEEHGRHVAAMQAREKAEAAVSPREVDARALRRAVVMAEILDRPVSMRQRRRAG